MNKSLLNELATWLENGAVHQTITFDMRTGISVLPSKFDPAKPTECGTACCIAGAAVQFAQKDAVDSWLRDYVQVPEFAHDNFLDSNAITGWRYIFQRAKDLLELDGTRAADLFAPGGEYDPMYGIGISDNLAEYNDPFWAARTIRHLIATGEVDWEACRYSMPGVAA